MKAQCLPFHQIPHTTRLFLDFLSWSAPIQQFFPHSPHFSEWLHDKTAAPPHDPGRRERVAAVLERQNQSWGSGTKTHENITRFRAGASVLVTGQQVGLLGGPLFAIFKALTAIKLAEQATTAGVDCVPVFWLATTDHDLAEVNHVFLPGPDGSLRKLTTPSQGTTGAPVGTVRFGPEIDAVVETSAELLGDSEAAALIRDAYRPGETLGTAFARLFARLFAGWGVILLDASDPELHSLAEPIYRAAIEQATELNHALLARGKELEAAGYHQQVKVGSSSTLLFTLRDGARVPIHRRNSEFLIAEEDASNLMGESSPVDLTVSKAELLARVASAPQDFSANVLLRPVLQDYLLPTLAYVGGAAEIAYFAQAAVVYQALLGKVTPVIPRFSATLVEAKSQALLERYGLGLPDLFHGPEVLRESLAKRALPQELQAAFDQADGALKKSLSSIQDELARLDKTLVEAAANAGSKIHHQLEQLRSRAARAELRQAEVLGRHAGLLSNALYPNKTLQERELGGIYVAARHGLEILRGLYDLIHTDCLDHQVVSL